MEESFIALAKSFEIWPHASQLFKCSATALVRIENCVAIAKNAAATLMMRTYVYFGNKEVALREAWGAIFTMENFWRSFGEVI
jgi:hypothetical protein